jgi:hypothetical protein
MPLFLYSLLHNVKKYFNIINMSVEEPHPPQPPGIIFSCDFNKLMDENALPADASIFFDDMSTNILDVQENVNKAGLNLRSVYCPPPPHPDAQRFVWYNNDGFAFEYQNYSEIKLLDDSFTNSFKGFINGIKTTQDNVGPGLTSGMIGKIIVHERTTKTIRQDILPSPRLYFFDFDMVLNQINGLDFSFLTKIHDDNEESLLQQYAKYLFSDCIGASCGVSGRLENLDRLKLLQIMFSTIGPERIYVITSNSFANIASPNRPYFIKLLRVLLPSFIETHLVCTHPKNKAPFYNKKSAAIIDILNSVRPNPPKSKSVRPQSSIAKPTSTSKPTSKKGGSKRTRNKRRRYRYSRRKS